MSAPSPRHLEDPGELRDLAADWLGADSPLDLVAVRWEPHQIALSFHRGRDEPLMVLLEPRDETRPRYLHTDQLNLSYLGSDLAPADQPVLAGLRAALHGRTFGALLERLEEVCGAPPATPAVADDPRPRPIAASWGRELLGDQFLAENMREGASIQLGPGTALVSHAEYECAFVHGAMPWSHHLPFVESRWAPMPFDRGDGAERAGFGAYFTDLSERDAVLGTGRGRLRAVLDAVRADPRYNACHLSAACVPVVIGDDVHGPMRAWREGGGGPLLFVAESQPSEFGPLVEALRQRAAAVDWDVAPPDRDAVHLVGYAEPRVLGELRGLLAAVGVQAPVAMIPRVHWDDLDRLPTAALQVLAPDDHYDELFEGFFRTLPRPAIAPGAPYGLVGTERWLKAIGEALGRKAEVTDGWTSLRAEVIERFEAGRRRAAGHALGLALSLDQLRRMLDPGRRHGLPLLPVLQELGFELSLMIGARGAPVAAVEGHARALLDPVLDRPPVSLAVYRDLDELHRLLRDGPHRAVYSEITDDRRLRAAGRPRFAWSDVEIGVHGALRTQARLLRICELPLYTVYRRHMGPERSRP